MNNYANALFQAKRRLLIIGLCGFTGSGCTTTGNILKSKKKPELPGHRNLESYIDKKSYEKLKKVWNRYEWQPFTHIEVAKVIFMHALHRALGSAYKVGPLSELRKIALPFRVQLKGLKYISSTQVNSSTDKISHELIAAYRMSISLYGQFKKKGFESLYDFIESMQNYGDDLRQHGNVLPASKSKPSPNNLFVLPESILRIIKAYRRVQSKSLFVIDAFRNPLEVEYFKRRYNEFYLVAVQRPTDERNAALLKNISQDALGKLVIREKGERIEKHVDNISDWLTSQNINECQQKADIFINNYKDTSKTWPDLRYHLIKLISLAFHPGCIPPSDSERIMQLAITARQNSGCISRHVGAVVVNKKGYVLGVGWNDPPTGQMPCAFRTGKELIEDLDHSTFSEYERSEEFISHMKEKHYRDEAFCFNDVLAEIKGKKNNEFTRAVHAEENALLQSMKHGAEALKDGALYTTDCTCTLCAKKAYQLGIKRVIYIEEYPGIAVDQTLKTGLHKIEVAQFEGITGSAYFRLFSMLLPEKDFLRLYK